MYIAWCIYLIVFQPASLNSTNTDPMEFFNFILATRIHSIWAIKMQCIVQVIIQAQSPSLPSLYGPSYIFSTVPQLLFPILGRLQYMYVVPVWALSSPNLVPPPLRGPHIYQTTDCP